MTPTPDHILDQALDRIAAGESFDRVLNSFPEYRADLAEHFQTMQLLSSIPKRTIPTPTRHYRFAEQLSLATKLKNLFVMYRLAAIPLAVMVLFLGAYPVLKATQDSLPGEKLYGLKTVAETARLSFIFDQNDLANYHVELAQKRLDEAKRAIESNDPAQETAAIEALTKQTDKTFSEVSQIAATKAVSQNDSSLLNNLVAINKEKNSVLQSATQSSDTKQAAETALTAGQETNKNLAKLIATVNEQTLADLPNKISVTGTVSSFSKTKLVVEKNSFGLNENTIVIDQTGAPVTDYATITGKVTVIGTRDNNLLQAKKVVIIDGSTALTEIDKPTVKGVTTTIKIEIKTPTPATSTTPTPNNIDAQKPSQAQAGFIAEPAAPALPQ